MKPFIDPESLEGAEREKAIADLEDWADSSLVFCNRCGAGFPRGEKSIFRRIHDERCDAIKEALPG